MKRTLPSYLAPAAVTLLALAACESPPPEPTPEPRPVGAQNTATQGAKPQTGQPVPGQKTQAQIAEERQKAMAAAQAAAANRKINAKPAAEVKASPDDPLKGKWTLEDATKGLPAGNAIIATIETDMGKLECRLFDDKAPITVANFIGLARGKRTWKNPDGKWVNEPAYDGTIFHRIIKGFMIQGGDAKKNGTGEAGYVIPDEVWEDAKHDRPGLLCMANRGPNTNSAQFFITDAAAAHLDYNDKDPRSSGYTIFGECGPVDLVHKLASVEMERGDKPKTPPVIKKVSITRKKVTEEKKAEEKKADEKKGDDKGSSTNAKTEGDPKKGTDAKAQPPGPKAPAPSEARRTTDTPGPKAPLPAE